MIVLLSFLCPSCAAHISGPTEEGPRSAYKYWRCASCGTAIPADADGEPLFDGDTVELIAQVDPDDYDAAIGDIGTIALANHVVQEGGPLVIPWGGFYSPSTLRLVRRGDPT